MPAPAPGIPPPARPAVGRDATIWLGLAAAAATALIFAVPPTPFDALDFRSILLPYLTYARDSLAAGDFPFWNPHASLGRPFAADPQAVVFWPPVLVYLGFDVFWGAIVLAWLHAWFAAWASAKLCLRLGAARAPALASGIAFVLSGKLTGHYQAGHVQFVFSYLYLPALLLAGLHVQEAGNRRAVAALGALTGWQLLAGAPQVYWSCAVGLGLFLAGRRLGDPLRPMLVNVVRDAGRVAVAYALGLALAGVLLAPLAGLIAESNRAVARPDFIAIGSMDWRHWASLLTPWTARDYTVDWEMLLYPGVAVTLLGLAGLARTQDRTVRGLLALLAGTVLLAAGKHTPLFNAFVDWLPGYASFRVHGRFGAVIVYALIVSAALYLPGGAATRRQKLAGLAALLACGLALGGLATGGGPVLRPALLLAASAAAAAAWLAWDSARARQLAGLGLAGVLATDLALTDLRLKSIFITSQNYSAEAPLVAALRETGRLRPGAPPPRVFAPPELVRANAGMLYGFGTVAGSEALALERVWSYVHWAVGREPPPVSDIYGFEAFAAKGLFPVPWVAQVAAVDPRAGRIEIRSEEPPRAWLVGAVRLTADWREAAGRLAAGYDARSGALLEAPLPPGPAPEPAAAGGAVRWLDFGRNRLALETESPAPGVLVLSEAWSAGWRATVDGADAPVFPVNGWMRGVLAPAGRHRVELSYRPPHFAAGLALTLAAAALLLWLARPRRADADR